MFGNTLVLPKSGGNVTLVKINQDGYASEYLFRDATAEHRVKIRHTTMTDKSESGQAYDRHNVEVTQRVFAAGEVPEFHRKVYIVVEQKPGDTDIQLADALSDWLIATANVNLNSLMAWES